VRATPCVYLISSTKKLFAVKIFTIAHSIGFSHTFFYSWGVKNNREVYLNKLLKQFGNFWGKKSANLALCVPDVRTL
tara:strand:+ start:238 stop:468 length:231 start_codon:yes stop_codon:yes gene_type:complete